MVNPLSVDWVSISVNAGPRSQPTTIASRSPSPRIVIALPWTTTDSS